MRIGLLIYLCCFSSSAWGECPNFSGKFRPSNITGRPDHYAIWEISQSDCTKISLNYFETDPRDLSVHKYRPEYSSSWTIIKPFPVDLNAPQPELGYFDLDTLVTSHKVIYSPGRMYTHCKNIWSLDENKNIQHRGVCRETYADGTRQSDFTFRLIHTRLADPNI